jgi:1-acyl-sn-glycerol-3-phosphate acyltransferase
MTVREHGHIPSSRSCTGIPGLLLRSLLFAVALFIVTPVYAAIALAAFALPRQARWRLISGWAHIVMWLARGILGLSYRVEGAASLPQRPALILSKHQSAWETIAFQLIFPPHVHVLKRELLWIPFFGWGLALMSPIAIDRSRGRRALRRIADLGAARLAQGFWIVIFPEGTRTRPGVRARYHPGGAWLAVNTGVEVVPVAHNAGLYWGRNAFLKRPGQIRILIGEPISPVGLTPEALNQKVEDWIESAMEKLCADV